MSAYNFKLRIGDCKILLESELRPTLRGDNNRCQPFRSRFNGKPDIVIKIAAATRLPKPGGKELFSVFHYEDGGENWRLFRKGRNYLFSCPIEGKHQFAIIKENLAETEMTIQRENPGKTYFPDDIVYDFLQVLFIMRLAASGEGIMAHAAAAADGRGRGFLLPGKSGAGKSTMARLWHKSGKGFIINDDRVLVQAKGKGFILYSTPWHGDFSDYLARKPALCALSAILMLRKAHRNKMATLTKSKAVTSLLASLFAPFWDRAGMERAAAFCARLASAVPCMEFSFKKDASAPAFAQKMELGND